MERVVTKFPNTRTEFIKCMHKPLRDAASPTTTPSSHPCSIPSTLTSSAHPLLRCRSWCSSVCRTCAKRLQPDANIMSTVKVQQHDLWQRSKSMSLDYSGAELSGSYCSTVEHNANVCDSAPRLIPTPSIPALDADDTPGDAHSGMSPFTSQEMIHIMKAEKLVGKLRHRFDCQPERYDCPAFQHPA